MNDSMSGGGGEPSPDSRHGQSRAGMEGFSDEFTDPEQYIVDITWRIWEGRGVDLIRDWYSGDCVVRTPHGVTNSVEPVVTGTRSTLAEFPDRQLLPEEIIIGCKDRGFYSSHRVRSTATHEGDGMFGKATRRAIGMLTIADCLCRENMIVEEWLVRDQAAMATQLGLDPASFGSAMGRANPAAYVVGLTAMEARWADPSGCPIIGDVGVARSIVDGMEALWKYRESDAQALRRDRALRFEGPSGLLCYGVERMREAVGGIQASIPDGEFAVHHVIVREDEAKPVRVAMRWSYCGTHSGEGIYGEPTGCPLAILAISHFELRAGKILNEWMLADDLSVYAQIAAYGMAGYREKNT